MKKGYLTKMSLGCLLCLLAAVSSCNIQIGCWPGVKYERTVQVSVPLQPGSVLAAQTHNGSITVTGADVADCNVIATIIARAATEEEAKRVAEETKIKLEPFGGKLTVKIEKPASMTNQSVSVNLNVTVPNHTDLQLSSHNGAIKISDITGEVNGTTHNGGAVASRVSGNIKLQTHNGSITCKETSGDMKLRTHNGSVKASYAETAPPVCNVSIVTHNGGVNFTAPVNFSAVVEVSTHNGSINTGLPITVIGKVSKRKLTGKIGTGEGKLHLETHNGSIRIR